MRKADRLLFKFSTTPKKSVHILDLWHVESVRDQPSLPHNLIHHDARISFINLPAVLAHFNFRKSLKYKGRHDFSNQRRDQSVPLFSLGTEKEKVEGASVVVEFLSAPVPLHQDRPRQMTRHASRPLSRTSLSRSRGHSSFRGHCHPENSHTPSTFLSTTQPFLRQLLPLQVRHPQQPSSLIFTFNSASKTPFIRGVSYTA